MDPKLIVLKLFLDELDVPSDIDDIDSRIRLQKAVYIGQLSGADLGYRFGWYLRGPYSTDLTQDYYRLSDALDAGENDCETMELHASLRSRLRKVKGLMSPPQGVQLSQPNWLELLASVDYLQRVSKMAPSDARNSLARLKPDLAPWFDSAQEQLKQAQLLP